MVGETPNLVTKLTDCDCKDKKFCKFAIIQRKQNRPTRRINYLRSRYTNDCKYASESGIDFILLWCKFRCSKHQNFVTSAGNSKNRFLDKSVRKKIIRLNSGG